MNRDCTCRTVSRGGRKLLEVPAAAPGGFTLNFNVDRNGVGPNITEAISKEAQVSPHTMLHSHASPLPFISRFSALSHTQRSF